MTEEHLYEEAGTVERRLETSRACEVHTQHYPRPHENHLHHVWPLGMGGPDIPENIVVVCPTGHSNIHVLLRQWIANRGAPPPAAQRPFGLEERKLARLGWERFTRKAME